MQLSSWGHSCWGLWPHSNYSICFLISVWTLVITAAFVVLWHPRPSTATRRDSGTEPEGSGSAGPRAREQQRGRRGEVRMRRRNKITEMRGIIFHISLPSTSCREQSSSGTVRLKMIPGIAAVSEFEVQVVGRIKCWLPRGVEDVCKCSTSNNPWQMHSFVTAFPPQSWREPHNITQWLWHW